MQKRKLTDKSAVKTYFRLTSAVKPYTWAIILAVFGLVVLAVADGLLYKSVVPQLLDKGLVAKQPEYLRIAPFIILGIFLSRGFGAFLTTYFMGLVGRNTVRDYRCKMMNHLMRLPVSFYDQSTSGDLVSKVNYDAEQVAAALTSAVSDTVRGIFLVISMLCVMFSTSWEISCAVLLIAPLLTYYLKRVSSHMRKYSARVQKTMGQVTHVASEVIEGNQVVRAFNGIDYEKTRVSEVMEENKKQEMKMFFVSASSVPAMQFIGASALALLVYIATTEVTGLSVGEFTGIFGAMLGLLRPIKQIAAVNSILQRGIAAAESIFDLLDSPVEEDLGKTPIVRVRGDIQFENVTFRYPTSVEGTENPWVLHNISFEVKAGETVALVGRSGSGKSSLVKLLPRLYQYTMGQINLDGISIQAIPLSDLRRQFALVTQDITLFNDTIENNIAYGPMRGKAKESIVAAAEAACALEFIEKLPDGFKTKIGDDGVLLSGGQRQCIAIARAILKDAPVIILDEATSALDTESERHIQLALNYLMQNRTTLVIAHRLSTIEHADKILVLDNGHLIEYGSHKVLMASEGKYAELQRSQQLTSLLETA